MVHLTSQITIPILSIFATTQAKSSACINGLQPAYIPAKINSYANLNHAEFVEILCSDTSCEHNELLTNIIKTINDEESLFYQYFDVADDGHHLNFHVLRDCNAVTYDSVDSNALIQKLYAVEFNPFTFDHLVTYVVTGNEEDEKSIVNPNSSKKSEKLTKFSNLDTEIHSRKIRAVNGPTIDVSTVIQLNLPPNKFQIGLTQAQKQSRVDDIVHKLIFRVDSILKQIHPNKPYNILVPGNAYEEHWNPTIAKNADKARISYKIQFNDPISNVDVRISDITGFIASGPADMDASGDLAGFHVIDDGSSSSLDNYDPCNSVFENDCDQNAVCSGIQNNRWFQLRQDEFGGENQYAAFFTCRCKDGFVSQRKYRELKERKR